jgi:predicted DsbA family dithiol-disulfide isomerase
MMKIVVFSDYICPFCFIGLETLRKVQPEVPAFTLEWKGFQIHPEYPVTGVPVEQRIAQFGQERYNAIWQNILALADGIGLKMQRPPLLTNSLPALEATEYAKEGGRGEEFSRSVYQAYFQQGKNIGDIDVLLPLAEETGLEVQDLQEHLQAGTYSARIRSFQQEAHSLGVSGVPTFIVGPAQIVGAQAPEVFINMLNRIAQRGLA